VKTFVKFCGLTAPEAVALVPAGGAAGFVIGVDGSPRAVSIARASELVESVPREAEAWGVVVDPSADVVHRLFDEVGVDRIQVYGTIPEGLDFLELHHLVPSVPIPPGGGGAPKPKVPPAESFPRVHLDSGGGALPGGSGTRADWDVCAELVESNPGRKFVLAGGLTPENVGEALARVRPWGVDVASGVESAPGVKDLDRMRRFVEAVAAAEATSHG
jgi:phosphoribosylanthranilate isomerase